MVDRALSKKEWAEVVHNARQAIREKQMSPLSFSLPELYFGVFVTLYWQDKLQGCMGNLTEKKLTPLSIARAAFSAAYNDSRFSPFRQDMAEETEIEITLLYDLEEQKKMDSFEPGTHGIWVRYREKQGLFLPKVAKEYAWDGRKTLEMVCLEKARLTSDEMNSSKLKIFFFKGEHCRTKL